MRSDGPKRGTVDTVRLPEPERGEGQPDMDGNLPAMSSRVVVELHGHPHRYVVRAVPTAEGPVLTELLMLSDDGAPIDFATVRSVPTRRLAYAAIQWLSRAGGLFAEPGDTADTHARPERARQRKDTDETLRELAGHVTDAVSLGAPVQRYVGQKMHISHATVDRWIRKAKARGLLPDEPLPRRKEKPRTQSEPSS